MPINVIKSKRDEEKWQKATEIATKAGQKENYAYIMGIYKKMKPDYKFNKTASVILRASKQGNSSKNFLKIANIGQKSTATQDFLGGFDPTGSFTGSYGLSNQARGKTDSEHRKSKGLAIAGGAVGSGLALPMATTGLVEGVTKGLKAKGGIGAKLTAGAKGFVEGAKMVPKTIMQASKIKSIANRAIRDGGTTLSKPEMEILKDLSGNLPLSTILGSSQKGNKLSPMDLANLMLRNRASKNLGQKMKRESDVGLKAGLSGIGSGATIGGGGAAIQYDKGRDSYTKSVKFDRRKR